MNTEPKYTFLLTLYTEYLTQLGSPTSCLTSYEITSSDPELHDEDYQRALQNTKCNLKNDRKPGVCKPYLVSSIMLVNEPLDTNETKNLYVYRMRFHIVYYRNYSDYPKTTNKEIDIESTNRVLTRQEFDNAVEFIRGKISDLGCVHQIETPFLVSWIRTLKE